MDGRGGKENVKGKLSQPVAFSTFSSQSKEEEERYPGARPFQMWEFEMKKMCSSGGTGNRGGSWWKGWRPDQPKDGDVFPGLASRPALS